MLLMFKILSLGQPPLLRSNIIDLAATNIIDVGRDAFTGVKFTSIIIPEVIYDYGSIGMSENPYLVNVTIQGLISRFPAYIFDACINLKQIWINGTLILRDNVLDLDVLGATRVGFHSFASLPITKLIFNNQTLFHYDAFNNCTGLTTANSTSAIPAQFQLPPQIRQMPTLRDLIMDKRSVITYRQLIVVTIEHVKSFHPDAFAGSNLISAFLPNEFTELSEGMFDGCLSLTTVSIPCLITDIPDRCFRECTVLGSLTINENKIIQYSGPFNSSVITRIGTDAFFQNAIITTIVLDCQNLILGDYAFAYATTLTSVKLIHLGGGLEVEQGGTPFYFTPNFLNLDIDGVACKDIGISFEELFTGSRLEGSSWANFGCTGPASAPPPPNNNDNDKSTKKGLSGGAIAAIVIVVILVVAIAGFAVFFILKKKGVFTKGAVFEQLL